MIFNNRYLVKRKLDQYFTIEYIVSEKTKTAYKLYDVIHNHFFWIDISSFEDEYIITEELGEVEDDENNLLNG